jgi:hypothetical protein
MDLHDLRLPAQTPLRQPSGSVLADWVSSLGTPIEDWLATAADYYTASAVYEQLSKRSDAELRRRGFSRAPLASDIICQVCDRANT